MKPNSKQKKYFGLTISALLHTPGLHFWALFYILFSSHLVNKGFVVIIVMLIKLSLFKGEKLRF